MPVLKEVEFSSEQVFELVKQLEFTKKIALLREITQEENYRKNFYAYTENLTDRYHIPQMSEDELDEFLHH